MNPTPRRVGLVKYVLLAALAAGGGTAGLYLSGGLAPAPAPEPVPADSPLQRFPLSALDVRDGIEAPELAADAAGRAYLTWASQTTPGERTVFLARASGGRFDPPAVVATTGVFKSVAQMKGKTMTRELRAVPHATAAGGAVRVAWTDALPDNAGVRLVLATSADGGATFGPPEPVHAGPARPTFTALAAGPGGALALSWLDNRDRGQEPVAAVRAAGSTAFAEPRVVHAGDDPRGTCPCCPTAAAFGPDGTLYVAFRNVKDGHRDFAVGRLKPGAEAFDGPFPVVPNTWKFDGCPHDGSSLAVVGDELHVAWMDARSGPQRCYHAAAKLSELAFTARELHAIPAGSQGNAKLFADAAGGLRAVWEESIGAEPPPAASAGGHQHDPVVPTPGSGGGRAILTAYRPAGASGFGPATAVAPKPGAFQTRPSVVAVGGNVFVAWNELDESGKAVVVTRLPGTGGTP